MRKFFFHLDIFITYCANFLKSRLSYRGDFLAFFLGDLFMELVGLLLIWTIYLHVPDIRGWRYGEILFIFGFSQITAGLFYTFFLNLFSLSEDYIIEGRFDRVLLRPLNTLFQVVIERIYLEECSQVLVGILVISYAVKRLGLPWSGFDYLLMIILLGSATLVYAGIFTGLLSFAFWFKERGGVWRPFEAMNIFGKYPVTIYNRLIKIAISWIIPYAFTAFYPATNFLGREEFQMYVWITPLIGLLCALGGYWIWKSGVRIYESTGS